MPSKRTNPSVEANVPQGVPSCLLMLEHLTNGYFSVMVWSSEG